MVKINVNGAIVEASPAEVIQSSEPWSEYQLADGTVVRVRYIVIGIYRTDGLRNSADQPIYHVQGRMIVDVRETR